MGLSDISPASALTSAASPLARSWTDVLREHCPHLYSEEETGIVPARLLVPMHRVNSVHSEQCKRWCAENLRREFTEAMQGRTCVLLFDDWEDALLFQRRWLCQ
jgi:hypothetical protein